MGILYDNSATAFIIVTLALGGGASWMSGRALAQSWQPSWIAIAYAALLALPARFLHWSLANGTLLTVHYLATDAAILIAVGLLSYRLAQTTQMVTQYPWLYERTSPLSWISKQEHSKQ